MEPLSLDSYVIDRLMPDLVGHDRSPAAFIVYLALWRAAPKPGSSAPLSHQKIATLTGLSRSAVQTALAHLHARELIISTRTTPTSVPKHRIMKPWDRLTRTPPK